MFPDPETLCLRGGAVGLQTSNLAVMGSILGPLVYQVNSAFHPSGVGKSSTSLHRLGLRWGVLTYVELQVKL